IVALERILVIHTGSPVEGASTPKPNIDVSLGGIFQILPNLAAVLRAEVDLNIDEPSLSTIPIEIGVQYTPMTILDCGMFARLENLNAKDPVKPFDQRSIGLFLRLRQ